MSKKQAYPTPGKYELHIDQRSFHSINTAE